VSNDSRNAIRLKANSILNREGRSGVDTPLLFL
jgi:hypothetical protein